MKRARNALLLIIGTSCLVMAAVTLPRGAGHRQEQPTPAASQLPPPATTGHDVHPPAPVPDEDWVVVFFEPLPDWQSYPVNNSPEAYEIITGRGCGEQGWSPQSPARRGGR